MNIFLSYGHDEYDKFALRLKADLEQSGFKVWMDVSGIRDTADWEKEIESGINWSDWFVIMMTQHSCRRPDGVCLDEVSYARFLGKQIAPIMIQDVKPPLCIARIQYIDMENFFAPGEIRFDEESYQAKFNTLCNVLRGVEQINMEGEYEVLRSRLIPLDNDVYYDHFRQNYYGREKLFRYYRDWVQGTSQLLWIVGNAGVGKTAFIAKLTENNDEITMKLRRSTSAATTTATVPIPSRRSCPSPITSPPRMRSISGSCWVCTTWSGYRRRASSGCLPICWQSR